MRISNSWLLGKENSLMVKDPEVCAPMHPEVLNAYKNLKHKARQAGFKLELTSGYRSYETQLSIWNRKARGEKALLDDQGLPLNYSKLSNQQITQAIMRWSAIPGASRHHWGTDLDVFDAFKMPKEKVELTPDEVDDQGPMGPLHQWLDSLIEKNEAFGFYRPYDKDRGGVAPERWHLSYAPLSTKLLSHYTYETFILAISDARLLLGEYILDKAQEYYQRYVLNVSNPL